MRYVFDITAFSAAMRWDVNLLAFLKTKRPGDFATVPSVIAEIEYGIRRMDSSSRKRSLLKAEKNRLLSSISVLPWQPDASVNFGKIKADLEARGKMIDDFDIAIASIAMTHRCGVLTANLRHFTRIKNLECRDW